MSPAELDADVLGFVRLQEGERRHHNRHLLTARKHPRNAHHRHADVASSGPLDAPEHKRERELNLAEIIDRQGPDQRRHGNQERAK